MMQKISLTDQKAIDKAFQENQEYYQWKQNTENYSPFYHIKLKKNPESSKED